MRIHVFGIGFAALVLVADVGFAADRTYRPVSTVEQAIELAATSRSGIDVEIDMPVKRMGEGAGHEKGRIFLDSEDDYRDPRSLNIQVFPDAVRDLKMRGGERFFETLVGRTVHVRGTVIRVPIRVMHLQKRVGYYFQTQMYVRSADDLRVSDGSIPAHSSSAEVVSRKP